MRKNVRWLLIPGLFVTATGCSTLTEDVGRMMLGTGGDYLRQHGMDRAAGVSDAFGRHLDAEMAARTLLDQLRRLEAIGGPNTHAAVEPHLLAEDARIRAAAVRALRADLSAAATAALIDRLANDAGVEVRVPAALLLCERDAAEAQAAILASVQRDTASAVRLAIAERLAAIVQPDVEVSAVLCRVAEQDPEEPVRAAARGGRS